MNEVTTRKPVSANALTPTHSHAYAGKQTLRQRDGALLEATLRPRQNVISYLKNSLPRIFT